MINILLSASIPLPERDARFYSSEKVIAIREAIKSLVDIVIPNGRIVFGGHPSITPLIAFFVKELELDKSHLTVFQSKYFEGKFPEENNFFNDVILVPGVGGDREKSLEIMRKEMITSYEFDAAVFVGGMGGVLLEAKYIARFLPRAKLMPIASTGGAAEIIYKAGAFPSDFISNLTYRSLFKKFLMQ